MNYQKLIKSKKFKIAVWGTGYIGLSTMVYFAKKKVKCVGYDINKDKINKINSGVLPLADLENWFGFDIKKLVKSNFLKATSNYKNLITEDFLVHFIAIPTEKDGKPYYKPLLNVLNNISKINYNPKNPPIIIVESTLAPKVSDKKIIPFLKKKKKIVGKNILLSIAPRRDWFIEGGKNLENLEKASVVFGGISYPKEKPEPEKQLRFVYGHKRESRSLALRKKQPYRSITLAAVAIKKDLFFKVDMPQTNSYGLDIYFSYRLKQLKVDVLHIENPVVHLGIESNSEFLSKTREGLDTMYTLEKNRFVSKTYRPLQVIASRFEKLKMAKSFIRLFERVEFKALKNLNSANPSLAVFGAWRLYHYLKLRRDEA
mgnify:CR=1 FL=1